MQSNPKLSIIVLTDKHYKTAQRSIRCLLEQTAIDDIELIIVCPKTDDLFPDIEEVLKFGCYQIVETGTALSTGHMTAAGVCAARAPTIFYVEEHNFPPPHTAEVIIREFRDKGRSALGLSIYPANPGLVAWANLYGQFGASVAPVKPGTIKQIGGHHAAYRRDLLLNYGNNLGNLLSNEAALHEDFSRRGVEIYLTSEIVIPHVQISRFIDYVRSDYIGQRQFAATRAKVLNWSLKRRALYVGATPLIPFLRLARSLKIIQKTGRSLELMPQIIPIIFFANIAGALGEALGYTFGENDRQNSARMQIELDRFSFVKRTDRVLTRRIESGSNQHSLSSEE